MYRKLVDRISLHHLIYLVVLLSSAMILVVVASYWKNGDLVSSLSAGSFEPRSISEQMEFNQKFFLIILLLLIIILGLVVDLAIHVARRDGFHKGLRQFNNHSSLPKLS